MATIDYKEKYEQALERAKYYHDRDNIQFLENIFPELCESDDERIRKELISFVRGMLSCHDKPNAERDEKYESWIAWLEKECEKDKFIEKELECIKGYREDAIKRLEELEKQSKDSPVLSDSSNIGKSVWSKEDDDNMIMIEDRLSDYFDYIREDSTLSKNQKKSLKEEIIRNVNWLKSLKDRVQPQPKQEWCGGDEAHLHSLITHLEQWIERHPNTTGADIQGENITWLKSLRPQSTWKPSNEQIEALDFAVDCIVWEEFCVKRKVLKGLLEQLKKL